MEEEDKTMVKEKEKKFIFPVKKEIKVEEWYKSSMFCTLLTLLRCYTLVKRLL